MLQRIPLLHAFQQQRPQPEINLDEILAGVKSFFNRITGRLGGGGIGLVILLIIGAIVVIWLATGLYRVPAGSQGVVRIFGDFTRVHRGPQRAAVTNGPPEVLFSLACCAPVP